MINTKHKRIKRHYSPSPSPLRAAAIGLVATILVSAVTLFFFSMIIFTTPDPGSCVLVGGLAALYISSFIGGFIAAMSDHDDALLCGLLNGAGILVLLLVLSLILPAERVSELGFWASALLHLVAIPFSMLGAYAASSLIRSRTQRRRRKRRS